MRARLLGPPLSWYPAEKLVILVVLVSSSASELPLSGSMYPAWSNSHIFSSETTMHPGWPRALDTLDMPGSVPTRRTSVFPLTALVTRPPKDSIIALALPLPRSKPWPPPSWGNTPVRTTVLPASTLATASPALGLGTMKPPPLGFCFLGLTTATAAVTTGSFFMTAGSFFTFTGFTFPGFTFPGF